MRCRSVFSAHRVGSSFLPAVALAFILTPSWEAEASTPASEPAANSKTASEAKDYPLPPPVVLPDGPARHLKGAVRVVEFTGIVSPGVGEHLAEAIAQAEADGDQMVLVELDTPGGLVTTTQKIVQAILGADVVVVIHVTPSGAQAASAGTFITMAGHIAAMAPATRIGAAHPVTGGGQDPEEAGGKHMAAKVENDLVALVTGISEERHRNAAWAEDAVRRSVSATADEAASLKVVDFVARDRQELFKKLEGREVLLNDEKVVLHPQAADVVVHEPSLRHQLLSLLANPGVASLLLLLGFVGIMVEVYNPGMFVPGIMGLLCFLCSLIAAEQLPIDLGAGLLVLVSLGLLIAELYTPTFGALGLMGVLGLSVGLMLLVDPSDPDFAVDPSIRLTMWDVLPLAGLVGGFVAYLSYFLASTRNRQASTGQEGMVGATGRVLKAVDGHGGQVFVAGEYWQATSTQPLEEGAAVRVVAVDGLRLKVRRG
ncbi:MAG: nodulation protein NfeD [Myxococcota bacterium]